MTIQELRAARQAMIEAIKENRVNLEQVSTELRADREVVLAAVRKHGGALSFASEELRGDRAVVLEAVKQGAKENAVILHRASEELRADREFVLAAIKQNAFALAGASEELRADREVVLLALQQGGRQNAVILDYASMELRADREFVLEAVKQNGRAFKGASELLRADRELVLEALKRGAKQHASILEDASDVLRSDRKFVFEAVRHNGRALKGASEELRDDREVVLEALKEGAIHNAIILNYASKKLRADRKFVLEAVRHNAFALGGASAEVRADREVVLEAVKHGAKKMAIILNDASEELRVDRDFVLEAVKHNQWALEGASEELRVDRRFVLMAIKKRGWALHGASKELRADREFVLEAVKQNGSALKGASEELRADREVVLAAVKQNGLNLYYASAELRVDREVLLHALNQCGLPLEFASGKRADREFVLRAVKNSGLALQFASDELRADWGVVLMAIRQTGRALEYASEELRADRTVVLEAVKQTGRALRYASKELRSDLEVVQLANRNDEEAEMCLSDGAPLSPTMVRNTRERFRRSSTGDLSLADPAPQPLPLSHFSPHLHSPPPAPVLSPPTSPARTPSLTAIQPSPIFAPLHGILHPKPQGKEEFESKEGPAAKESAGASREPPVPTLFALPPLAYARPEDVEEEETKRFKSVEEARKSVDEAKQKWCAPLLGKEEGSQASPVDKEKATSTSKPPPQSPPSTQPPIPSASCQQPLPLHTTQRPPTPALTIQMVEKGQVNTSGSPAPTSDLVAHPPPLACTMPGSMATSASKEATHLAPSHPPLPTAQREIPSSSCQRSEAKPLVLEQEEEGHPTPRSHPPPPTVFAPRPPHTQHAQQSCVESVVDQQEEMSKTREVPVKNENASREKEEDLRHQQLGGSDLGATPNAFGKDGLRLNRSCDESQNDFKGKLRDFVGLATPRDNLKVGEGTNTPPPQPPLPTTQPHCLSPVTFPPSTVQSARPTSQELEGESFPSTHLPTPSPSLCPAHTPHPPPQTTQQPLRDSSSPPFRGLAQPSPPTNPRPPSPPQSPRSHHPAPTPNPSCASPPPTPPHAALLPAPTSPNISLVGSQQTPRIDLPPGTAHLPTLEGREERKTFSTPHHPRPTSDLPLCQPPISHPPLPTTHQPSHNSTPPPATTSFPPPMTQSVEKEQGKSFTGRKMCPPTVGDVEPAASYTGPPNPDLPRSPDLTRHSPLNTAQLPLPNSCLPTSQPTTQQPSPSPPKPRHHPPPTSNPPPPSPPPTTPPVISPTSPSVHHSSPMSHLTSGNPHLQAARNDIPEGEDGSFAKKDALVEEEGATPSTLSHAQVQRESMTPGERRESQPTPEGQPSSSIPNRPPPPPDTPDTSSGNIEKQVGMVVDAGREMATSRKEPVEREKELHLVTPHLLPHRPTPPASVEKDVGSSVDEEKVASKSNHANSSSDHPPLPTTQCPPTPPPPEANTESLTKDLCKAVKNAPTYPPPPTPDLPPCPSPTVAPVLTQSLPHRANPQELSPQPLQCSHSPPTPNSHPPSPPPPTPPHTSQVEAPTSPRIPLVPLVGQHMPSTFDHENGTPHLQAGKNEKSDSKERSCENKDVLMPGEAALHTPSAAAPSSESTSGQVKKGSWGPGRKEDSQHAAAQFLAANPNQSPTHPPPLPNNLPGGIEKEEVKVMDEGKVMEKRKKEPVEMEHALTVEQKAQDDKKKETTKQGNAPTSEDKQEECHLATHYFLPQTPILEKDQGKSFKSTLVEVDRCATWPPPPTADRPPCLTSAPSPRLSITQPPLPFSPPTPRTTRQLSPTRPNPPLAPTPSSAHVASSREEPAKKTHASTREEKMEMSERTKEQVERERASSGANANDDLRLADHANAPPDHLPTMQPPTRNSTCPPSPPLPSTPSPPMTQSVESEHRKTCKNPKGFPPTLEEAELSANYPPPHHTDLTLSPNRTPHTPLDSNQPPLLNPSCPPTPQPTTQLSPPPYNAAHHPPSTSNPTPPPPPLPAQPLIAPTSPRVHHPSPMLQLARANSHLETGRKEISESEVGSRAKKEVVEEAAPPTPFTTAHVTRSTSEQEKRESAVPGERGESQPALLPFAIPNLPPHPPLSPDISLVTPEKQDAKVVEKGKETAMNRKDPVEREAGKVREEPCEATPHLPAHRPPPQVSTVEDERETSRRHHANSSSPRTPLTSTQPPPNPPPSIADSLQNHTQSLKSEQGTAFKTTLGMVEPSSTYPPPPTPDVRSFHAMSPSLSQSSPPSPNTRQLSPQLLPCSHSPSNLNSPHPSPPPPTSPPTSQVTAPTSPRGPLVGQSTSPTFELPRGTPHLQAARNQASTSKDGSCANIDALMVREAASPKAKGQVNKKSEEVEEKDKDQPHPAAQLLSAMPKLPPQPWTAPNTLAGGTSRDVVNVVVNEEETSRGKIESVQKENATSGSQDEERFHTQARGRDK